MKLKILQEIGKIEKLPRSIRRSLFIISDSFLILISIYLCSYITRSNISANNFFTYSPEIVSSIFISIFLLSFFGQYKGIAKYQGSEIIYKLIIRNSIPVLVLYSIQNIFNLNLFTYKQDYIVLWLLINTISILLRFSIRGVLINSFQSEMNRVVIYGAGAAGSQLAIALKNESKHKIIAFIDDDSQLWGRSLYGITIYSPSILERNYINLDQILIAIPSLTSVDKKHLVSSLGKYQLPVFEIPSINQITTKQARIDTLIPIELTDLLGREETQYNTELISSFFKEKSICITGAAGSIGSGLCFQLLNLKPRKLIVFDMSEASLYELNDKLTNLNLSEIKIIPVLGNATNYSLVKRVINENEVDIIFHAAAYKHVPLVETNPIEGLLNNFLSTEVICRASLNTDVRQVVLISSDKAVRPTNIMGASKRLSEIIIQWYSNLCKSKETTKDKLFSMVRFGNVLGSSGSVVPLFKKQIAKGGPITITHEKIIRYFMTIPEATSLVLHSAVLSKGGELFLLDMGKPVRIKELAEKMIKLSGLKLKNTNNPKGDIEITITGLRPGEKLFEELLINQNESTPTSHKRIFKAMEKTDNIIDENLPEILENLKISLEKQDRISSLSILKRLVPEWSPNNKIKPY